MAETAYAETIGTAEMDAPPPRAISAEQTRLVQTSYSFIEPASDLVATLFFRRLHRHRRDHGGVGLKRTEKRRGGSCQPAPLFRVFASEL